MMRSVNNTVETINAAASAIVSAESRAQPNTVPRRRWGGCWSLYWCFGSHKNNKRIGHAVLVPEPQMSGAVAPAGEVQTGSTAIALPFIAPPSSPASFRQSDPPSAIQSPAGLRSVTSLSVNAFSPGGSASIFSIGPYAHETQLVTPPVFSAFPTEPSTASYTPPPESVQMTTPSSPEVPFAQLLTSSLERARRNSGTNQKFGLTNAEFQPYLYPGSPGGQLISPGSVISNSGTSSPFPDRQPILEFHMGEAPRILGFEHFTTRKWGSRLGSGSLTPDGAGLGSRLGSGAVTPDGMGLGSRLGSGSVTPDSVGLRSRLGSGSLTPELVVPASQVGLLLENQMSDVASLANSENGSRDNEVVVNHRVSFELSGEEVARCLESKSMSSTKSVSGCSQNIVAEDRAESIGVPVNGECSARETLNEAPEKQLGETEEEQFSKKQRSITLGSIKEFNFDSSNGEVPDKHNMSSEWWANETIAGMEAGPASNWTFFPLLQPEVS